MDAIQPLPAPVILESEDHSSLAAQKAMPSLNDGHTLFTVQRLSHHATLQSMNSYGQLLTALLCLPTEDEAGDIFAQYMTHLSVCSILLLRLFVPL